MKLEPFEYVNYVGEDPIIFTHSNNYKVKWKKYGNLWNTLLQWHHITYQQPDAVAKQYNVYIINCNGLSP